MATLDGARRVPPDLCPSRPSITARMPPPSLMLPDRPLISPLPTPDADGVPLPATLSDVGLIRSDSLESAMKADALPRDGKVALPETALLLPRLR